MKKFLNVSEVAERLGVSKASIWRWSKDFSSFPAPIRLTHGCTRWSVKDIEAWENEKIGEAA